MDRSVNPLEVHDSLSFLNAYCGPSSVRPFAAVTPRQLTPAATTAQTPLPA